MKVNLIYDMRHGGSGWFGGFSEERKEDAVIAVLENCRNSDGFWKIVDSVENSPDPFMDKFKIDELLDFSQQEKYNNLKLKFRNV